MLLCALSVRYDTQSPDASYATSGLILMGNRYDGLHPRFESFLQLGWDPLFDMAPYCLTALVFLLGPVPLVTGSTIQVHGDITIANPQSPRCGETVPIAAPMNTTVTLDFESGPIATL